jgi:hypothetical protein
MASLDGFRETVNAKNGTSNSLQRCLQLSIVGNIVKYGGASAECNSKVCESPLVQFVRAVSKPRLALRYPQLVQPLW